MAQHQPQAGTLAAVDRQAGTTIPTPRTALPAPERG